MREMLAYLLSLSFLISASGYKGDSKNQDSETEITISAVGDCTLGRDDRGSYTYSLPYYLEINGYDYSYFFRNVYDILSQDDLTIANLEGPLTDSTMRADKQFTFKGDPSYTNILTEGSVEAVNLANNHTMDFGKEGYEDTIQALENAHLSYFGNGVYDILDIQGIKVGLAGIKGFSESGAKAEIDQAKNYFLQNQVDLIIYNFHQGIEREYKQNQTQENIARYAIDYGNANLVIGHHPHVLQGIEKYHGVYIVYSLGNFVFGGNKNPSDKNTMIIQMHFTFQDQTLTETNLTLIPATLSSTMTTNNYQPTLADENTEQLILKRVLENSTNYEFKN